MSYIGVRKAPSKKGSFEQAGHEALRPVDVSITPEVLKSYGVSGILLKIYALIWHRALGSLCAPAKYAEEVITIKNGKHRFQFTTKVLVFPGYLALE